MRLIVEARLEGAQTSATADEATIVDVVERQDRSVADLGRVWYKILTERDRSE